MNFFKKIFKPRSTAEILADQVLSERLTYLGKEALVDLAQAVESVEVANIEGVIVEAGCALGGSSIVICRTKQKWRKFYVYDVFGTIPNPGEKDQVVAHERYKEISEGRSIGIGGDVYYGYRPSLLDNVKQKFRDFDVPPEKNNVTFIQGLYEQTMRIDFPVVLAHIDCDWYASVMICLEQIVPCMVSGALLILDDYHYWPGCKKAVDEFFSGKTREFEFIERSRLHIRKR
ncbi:MAG: asparagine synthase [Nitrospira sp. LK70]|nr:asparagine synthase [Nitrospira sp. LK70]